MSIQAELLIRAWLQAGPDAAGRPRAAELQQGDVLGDL